MNRQDYNQIADLFLRTKPPAESQTFSLWLVLVKDSAAIFAADNPNFDEARYFYACGVQSD